MGELRPQRASISEARFVLFNIDWYRIFDDSLDPHGIAPEALVQKAWLSAPIPDRQLMLRHILAGVANSQLDLSQTSHIIAPEALQRASRWAMTVSRLSAFKYRLLGEVTQRDPDRIKFKEKPVLVTVIEKHSRPEIPALMLLGNDTEALSRNTWSLFCSVTAASGTFLTIFSSGRRDRFV